MPSDFSPIHRPPIGGEYYVFRDAIHNLIEIENANDGKYIRELLRTTEMQRLRRLKQNGLSFLVYASLETTRFPHALGSFHVARRIVDSLLYRQPAPEDGFPECLRLTKRDCLAFSIAALLHDLGHGPLSHVWEECWAEPLGSSHFHEEMGIRIASDHATGVGGVLARSDSHQHFGHIGRDVLSFLSKRHHLDYLSPLLEGNLDVDRLDFIARDTRGAGVTYGFHDLEWIIRSLRFARLPSRYINGLPPRWVIAIDGRKGLSTLVQFLHARENMYRLVYLHKTTRAATLMLTLLFKRARKLAMTSTLSCRSPELREALSLEHSGQISVQRFLKLDDSDVWTTIKAWADGESGDFILSDLSQRLLSRDLFKIFVLSEDAYRRLREIDASATGQNLRSIVKSRLNCESEDAEYYYTFDMKDCDVIGHEPQKPWHNVWIMESGALGFEFRTLKEYWEREVHGAERTSQHLLIVHPEVVQDLAGIVERLSFRSSKQVETLPEAPSPYKVIAPLGSEGAWKEVYVGTNTDPGSQPEKVVALKRYKTGEDASIDKDVTAINLLSEPHPNLSSPRHLKGDRGEKWILEPLWTASLEDLVERHGPRRDILEIFEIAEQLFSGLSQMHDHNLRHTDIKPDNCGILAASTTSKRYVLGDFGCLSSKPNDMPKDRRFLGTLRTRAPEVILEKDISLKSDVWSLAATIYALCLKKYPFMPFNAPHDDSNDRRNRESQIAADIAALLKQHNQDVKVLLPPILGRELEKCFQEPRDRPAAKHALKSFRRIRSDLTGQKGKLLRTAWQRAEDIVQLFSEINDPIRDGGLSVEERMEMESLINDHVEFIPSNLKEAIESLLVSHNGERDR